MPVSVYVAATKKLLKNPGKKIQGLKFRRNETWYENKKLNQLNKPKN
jgi:hypothetical protein